MKTYYLCNVCYSGENVENHRIIPGLKYGGKYTEENVIRLCKKHHYRVHILLRKLIKRKNPNPFEEAINLVKKEYEKENDQTKVQSHS